MLQYEELPQAIEMFLSQPYFNYFYHSPLFQMAGTQEECVSCFSRPQTPSFFTSSCCRLLRGFHCDLQWAVPLIACSFHHPLSVKMQRPTAKQQAVVRESCGSVGGRVVVARRVRKPQEDLQSTNLGSWSSQRRNNEPTPCRGLNQDCYINETDVHLGLHVGD